MARKFMVPKLDTRIGLHLTAQQYAIVEELAKAFGGIYAMGVRDLIDRKGPELLREKFGVSDGPQEAA
jgi:hypothetical protein